MLVYKQNKMFKLNDNELPNSAKTAAVKNALYADIYTEFLGANENPKYKDLGLVQRMEAVNTFAINWLNTKGYN